MDLPDEELVRRLLARDGPMAPRSWRHTDAAGRCRYVALYPKGDCPWCAAEAKRRRPSRHRNKPSPQPSP